MRVEATRRMEALIDDEGSMVAAHFAGNSMLVIDGTFEVHEIDELISHLMSWKKTGKLDLAAATPVSAEATQ